MVYFEERDTDLINVAADFNAFIRLYSTAEEPDILGARN